MKRAVLVGVASVLVVGLLWAQKKTKDVVLPGVILHAHYVYVTAFRGDQFNARVMQADRFAINSVIDALKKWGRYAVTYDQNNADLVLVVRKGKIADLKVGGQVSTGTPGTSAGSFGGIEGGGPDDTLMVMENNGPPLDTSALWRRSAPNGLDGPDPSLVAAFKKDVEQAAANKKP